MSGKAHTSSTAGHFISILDLLFLCIIWGSWLQQKANGQQGVCRMRTIEFLPPKKGHYLKNYVVSNITIGTSFRECEHHCLKTRECVSVNIGPTIDHKIICELTNSDDIQHPEDLIVRPGWTYVATENVCSILKPCLNNAQCLLGDTEKKYRCVCASGFTGETCENDYDECIDKPCLNGGTCINQKGNFSCICPGTHIGQICQACQGQAVGVADRSIIPDNKMTASSYYNTYFYPWYARLNQYLGGGGWCPNNTGPPGTEYLQVDMGALHSVCSVATQGAARISEWTKSFKLNFSSDGVNWSVYRDKNAEKVFPGNTDQNSIVKNSLDTAVTARYVRFYYVTYKSWPSIRVEIYVVK